MPKTDHDRKIVFLGTPRFAETILRLLIQSPFRPILVVTEPDRPAGRGQRITASPVKQLALKAGIRIAQPTSHQELIEVIRQTQPEVGMVAAYGRILKPELLAVPKRGWLNVHASLLPRYRGASPIQAAILAGDQKTGATIIELDEGLDTGPILAQASVVISSNDTTETLGKKLAQAGGQLLLKVLPSYLSGQLSPQPQPTSATIVTNLLTKESGRLKGNESPELILRMLRAYSPWPGVWFELDRQRIILKTARQAGESLIPDQIQLADKRPVDWSAVLRDRPELARTILHFLNQA